MRLARGQQLILRCGGTDAARQDTPPEPVKEFEAGHSRDPSNIRLLFAWRRARRVRARLPPPPPSRVGARTPGLLQAHRRFLVVFWALSAVTGKAPGKREAAEARSRAMSRRSSRKPGFVVRGGRSRDTRPRTADLGSGDRGHGPMLSPDPCKSLAPPRVQTDIHRAVDAGEVRLAKPRPGATRPRRAGRGSVNMITVKPLSKNPGALQSDRRSSSGDKRSPS